MHLYGVEGCLCAYGMIYVLFTFGVVLWKILSEGLARKTCTLPTEEAILTILL
jgi:hypothetical protein